MDLPLVTIALITYNQERYVREAVCSVLAQTYKNLRIVISDDGSGDGTVGVIQRELERYAQSGGVHKDIALNVNRRNLGITGNWGEVVRLARGELLFAAAGDDISDPMRVERIVDQWERSGRRATIIHHAALAVDLDGRFIERIPARSVWAPQGATAVYAMSVFSKFPPLPEMMPVEDVPWSMRAYMFGDELQVDEPLVSCRRGSGVSTQFGLGRRCRIGLARFNYPSYQLLEKDIESQKEEIPQIKYDEVCHFVVEHKWRAYYTLQLLTEPSFGKRMAAIRWFRNESSAYRRRRDYVRYCLLYAAPLPLHEAVTALADIIFSTSHWTLGVLRSLMHD